MPLYILCSINILYILSIVYSECALGVLYLAVLHFYTAVEQPSGEETRPPPSYR